ncbi:MAG: hypothetical protein AAF849_00835 [Bacteroidota bacterium]
MNKTALVIIFLMITVGFVNGQEKKTISNSKIGSTIILPDNALIRNTVSNKVNPLEKEIKIFTTIDGNCGQCAIELNSWKSFMEELKNSNIGFIYLIESSDKMRTFNTMNNEGINLDYPVFYDEGKKIYVKNNLSDSKHFNTFLLNSKNEIVLTGSPIVNEDIAMLYKQKIDSLNLSSKDYHIKVNQDATGTGVRISGNIIYMDEDKNVIDENKAKQMIASRDFYPSINTNSNVIILKKVK